MKSKPWPAARFVALLGIGLSLLCGCGKHNEAGIAAAAEAQALPSRIAIQAKHLGWGMHSANLTLVLSNRVYRAGSFTVEPVLVSNLIAAAQRPWPQAGSWVEFPIDFENLGLNAAWAKTNQQRLLELFSGDPKSAPFPNASGRQRRWLTNALADIRQLEASVRHLYEQVWTDDSPSMSLQFEDDGGRFVAEPLQISTKSQWPFLLPWQVRVGTNQFVSGNADISRAVAAILPPGFLLRDRLDRDPAQLVDYGFFSVVHNYLIQSTLEETFGESAHLPRGFRLEQCWITAASRDRIPEAIQATAHRTNWPGGLTAPVSSRIACGVATNLDAALAEAGAKVELLLQQPWLRQRVLNTTNISVQLLERSPDQPWMRTHMNQARRNAFYDRIQSEFSRTIGFTMRESGERVSEWALFEDGRLLLYGFAGDGVLDWSPAELGFRGDSRLLQSSGSINYVGVFVGPDGKIAEVVAPE
jgi:hypothetical protein